VPIRRASPRPEGADVSHGWGEWVAFALFIAFALTGVMKHEPWRDEAQAWLLARDAGLWDLFSRLAGLEGSPVLWHLVNMPFARLGLSYGWEAAINLVFVTGAVAITLWRAPMPLWMRVGFIFSYFVVYEYAVIARSYGLGMFLLCGALALDGERMKRPVLYGLTLALLANAHAFALMFSIALLVVWLPWSDGRPRGRIVAGVLIAILGIAAALWQMVPPERGAPPAGLAAVEPIEQARIGFSVFAKALFIPGRLYLISHLANSVVGLTWVLLLFSIRRGWRGLFVFATVAAGLLVIALFVRPVDLRHVGHLILGLLAVIWLGREQANAGAVLRALGKLALVGVFLLSFIGAARALLRDYEQVFSPGRQMAAYLSDPALSGRTIIANSVPFASAALPYLPGVRVWSPGSQTWATYVVWGSGDNRRLTTDDMLARLPPGVPPEAAIYLVSEPIDRPDFVLLRKAEGIKGTLYLYEMASAAQ